MTDRRVWEEVKAVARLERNFDSDDHCLPHFCLPVAPENGRRVHLNRPLIEQDLRGSMQAISELSGYYAATLSCDPTNPTARDGVRAAAEALSEMAGGLLAALDAEDADE